MRFKRAGEKFVTGYSTGGKIDHGINVQLEGLYYLDEEIILNISSNFSNGLQNSSAAKLAR